MTATVEETVARFMAAEDWLEDRADDVWWNSRLAEFREQYLESAREVIGIVRGDAADWLIAEYPGPGTDVAIRRAADRLRHPATQNAREAAAAPVEQGEVAAP